MIMDWVAGLYAIYGLDDVILNIEGRMQMKYNINGYNNVKYVSFFVFFV